MSRFVLSDLNGPWFIVFGLAAWAVAYVYLTRVISPDSIGDLMTLIIAVLPVFTFIIALTVTILSLTTRHQHIFQGTVFAFIAALALTVTVVQYVRSKDQRSEIRGALKRTAMRHHPLRSTIAIISWGLFGAILVFASELGLVIGGWQFLQGSKIIGLAWAGPSVVIVLLSIHGDYPPTKNPIRRAVLALKDDDHDSSVTFVNRLLEPARRQDKAEPVTGQPLALLSHSGTKMSVPLDRSEAGVRAVPRSVTARTSGRDDRHEVIQGGHAGLPSTTTATHTACHSAPPSTNSPVMTHWLLGAFGPRTHIQVSDLAIFIRQHQPDVQRRRSQAYGFKSLPDTALRTCPPQWRYYGTASYLMPDCSGASFASVQGLVRCSGPHLRHDPCASPVIDGTLHEPAACVAVRVGESECLPQFRPGERAVNRRNREVGMASAISLAGTPAARSVVTMARMARLLRNRAGKEALPSRPPPRCGWSSARRTKHR
jgi:hypothetical protein